MIERTYYFPATRVGHYIINYIVERVDCSIGDIRKVADSLAVPITVQKKDVCKVERILQMYNLL